MSAARPGSDAALIGTGTLISTTHDLGATR